MPWRLFSARHANKRWSPASYTIKSISMVLFHNAHLYLDRSSFAAAIPMLWNDLPLNIKRSPSMDISRLILRRICSNLQISRYSFNVFMNGVCYHFMLCTMECFCSYVTRIFTSALVSKGHISIWNNCRIIIIIIITIIIIIIIIHHHHHSSSSSPSSSSSSSSIFSSSSSSSSSIFSSSTRVLGILIFASERIGMDLTWSRVCNQTAMNGANVGLDKANNNINLDIKDVLLKKTWVQCPTMTT